MGAPLRRLLSRAHLAALVLVTFVGVRLRVHRTTLPVLTARLSTPPRRARSPHRPARLSRAVDRTLRLGKRQPTCLVNALVLFRLLRAQGDPAELVVGLPAHPASKDAHAWVELAHRDLGPAPGRSGHLELARYPMVSARLTPEQEAGR